MTDPSAGATSAPAGMTGRDDTVVRGTALAFAAQVAGGVFTGALTVFLARRLGSTVYGVFALALSIETLLFLVSDFGVTQALQRFVAENRHDRLVACELVRDALRLKLLGCLVAGAALAVLADPIAHAYGSPRLTWTLRGIAVSLLGMNLLLMFAGVFTALRRQAMTLTAFFLESAMELAATLTFVLIAGGAAAAAFGRAVGYLFGATVAIVLTVRLLGRGAVTPFARPQRHFRRIVGDAGALLVVDGAYSLFTQIDSLLIGGFLTVTSVGLWQAPLRLVVLLVYPGQAISSAVAPRLASSDRQRGEPETFTAAVRVLLVLMAAVTAVSTAWATPIIRLLLGSSFRESADVLRALAPFVFLSGLGPLVSVGMNYLGAARRRIPIAVATVLVNLILDLILIPRIGVLGGAIGTDAALLIYVPAHFRYCQRALDLPSGAMARTLARSLLAGGAMALVLVAVGTGEISAGGLLVGAVLGTGAFAATLLVTREITRRELVLLWAAVRKRGGKGESTPPTQQ